MLCSIVMYSYIYAEISAFFFTWTCTNTHHSFYTRAVVIEPPARLAMLVCELNIAEGTNAGASRAKRRDDRRGRRGLRAQAPCCFIFQSDGVEAGGR
jgi:hypothetical protein